MGYTVPSKFVKALEPMDWEPNDDLIGIKSFDARKQRYGDFWRILPRSNKHNTRLLVLPSMMQLLKLNASKYQRS